MTGVPDFSTAVDAASLRDATVRAAGDDAPGGGGATSPVEARAQESGKLHFADVPSHPSAMCVLGDGIFEDGGDADLPRRLGVRREEEVDRGFDPRLGNNPAYSTPCP